MALKWMLMLLFCYSTIQANCLIYQNERPLEARYQDALSLLFTDLDQCPESYQEFDQLLQKNQLQMSTAMVANRGKDNPSEGSFSFFSSLTGVLANGFIIKKGEFFLGHFTSLEANEVHLDQSIGEGKLLIELIAWDKQEQVYHFYELRGLTNGKTRWFYRGDSKDAYLDNQYLYRDVADGKQKFGKRMRCSACHDSGGPIMKEIKSPHNDWWTHSNPLSLLPNRPDSEVNALIQDLVDASQFSAQVLAGIKQLNHSVPFEQFKQGLSLQEQLRPLFCTVEINLESTVRPGLDSPVHIPSGFWLNPLLGQFDMKISAKKYLKRLKIHQMRFPETQRLDANHAWLTPVKGVSDINAIQALIKTQRITRQFARRILMIDFQHPVFSQQRCALLKHMPKVMVKDWPTKFLKNLQKNNQPEAIRLARFLSDPHHYDKDHFDKLILRYQAKVRKALITEAGLEGYFTQLLSLRQAVQENELSQNPLGQILEPGFRVVFPLPN